MLFQPIQGTKVDGRHSGGATGRAGMAAQHLVGATRSPGVPPADLCARKSGAGGRFPPCRHNIAPKLSRDPPNVILSASSRRLRVQVVGV
jgi:hypothetical protein